MTDFKSEEDRYIDFNGTPIEAGPIKRILHNWGLIATFVAAAGFYAANSYDSRNPLKVAFGTCSSLLFVHLMREGLRRSADNNIPPLVIDTKPQPGTISALSEWDLDEIECFYKKLGPKIATVNAIAIAGALAGIPLIGVPVFQLKMIPVWRHVIDRKYVVIARDQMKEYQPEATKEQQAQLALA